MFSSEPTAVPPDVQSSHIVLQFSFSFFVGEQPSFMIQKDLQTAEYRAPFKSDALLQNKKLSKNEV